MVRAFQAVSSEVVVLTRGSAKAHGSARYVSWDAEHDGDWTTVVDGAEAVVNLVGEPINQRWSESARRSIMGSRVNSTRAVGRAIEAASKPPRIWVNASATGYYGNRGDEWLSEDSGPGNASEFLVETCLAWEAALHDASTPRTGKAALRIGLVLGAGGGMLEVLTKLTKGFLGGQVASGQMWMPWVHVEDLARAAVFAVERDLQGPINGSASGPVTNGELMAQLRARLRRPWSPPAPEFAIRLAGSLGIVEPALVLTSARVRPDRLIREGFDFSFPSLEEALADLL